MTRHLVALAAVMLVLTGCGRDDEPEPTQEPSPPAETTEPTPEPTSAVPQGSGSGDVEVSVDGQDVPGDDWDASCFEKDGGIGFSAIAEPMSTVQLEVDADGAVTRFVASGEGYGPFEGDESTASGMEVETTDTGFSLGGTLEGAGSVAGTLTCPE